GANWSAGLAAGALLLALPGSGLGAQGTALDRAPSRFALYNGTRVHFKSLGAGTTAVVFVHGWSCDLTFWRAQVPAVDGRVRAIFLDLPGFGRSDKPDVAYTMDYFAGAVDAVLRASVKRQMMATPQRVAASAMRGMADGAIWRDDPIEVPLLAVMAGSRNWSADYVAYVKRLAPGVRYETMSGVGHFLMLERP